MMSFAQIPNQRENERVELFLRRHWITFFTQLLALVMLLGVPLAIWLAFRAPIAKIMAHPLLGPTIAVALSIYVLAVWLYAFIEFTDYYLDTWIVTNDRIMNIEQEGLFHRTISELDLAAVQDVTSDVAGVGRTLINYGDVFIQTAGEKERFVFKAVPNPAFVTQKTAALVEADRRRHGMKDYAPPIPKKKRD